VAGILVCMERRELAHRSANGIDVSLLWDPEQDSLAVLAFDTRDGECLEVEVREGDDPMDVFEHPFAYAAHRAGTLEPLRL
jgi:hypothetical protein